MPGISQRVMRIGERATRWRPRGRLALALIAPAIVVAAASRRCPPPHQPPSRRPRSRARHPAGRPSSATTSTAGPGSGIDSQWMYDTGPGSSFGTGEIETMTNSTSNVHLDGNGNLDITALGSGSSWTSGRVQTTSANVGAPAGGELEVTASIEQPSGGLGYWPAFWMLGPGPVAGERRDRHHGGRQLAVGAVWDRPLRRRSRRPVQRARTASAADCAGLLGLPVRLPHLHDDPEPDQHVERVDHVLPGRQLVLHRDRGAGRHVDVAGGVRP